ncbi:MAG: redoxin domain-containing protein [Verrucomicrobia bacterium]|jgi:protein SCO1/2|nr:redoxin domain-containing protein [Verrucomicrobiota bacterium]
MQKNNSSSARIPRILNQGSLSPAFGIRHKRITRTALATLLALLTATIPAQAETVRDGDTAPEAQLLNEQGKPTQLHAEGRATVMTFIFTRCAAMEFCPKMNSKFNELQAAIQKEGLQDQARLLSITLDPEFDRPERLKEFSEAMEIDPAVWNFATGSKAQIDRLTKDFRVFTETKDGVLNHTLCTALVRPDGTVEKIWRGNFWKPDDVLAKLRSLNQSK